jgi:hypothetical protein
MWSLSNSVVVHPQVSDNGFPMDGAPAGAGPHNP